MPTKPCPFCNGQSHIEYRGHLAHVECENCGAESSGCSVPDNGVHRTVELWNERYVDCGQWIDIRKQEPDRSEPILVATPRHGFGSGKWGVSIAYWCVSSHWIPEKESFDANRAIQGWTHWKPLGGLPQ